MVTSPVGGSCSEEGIVKLLKIMEDVGRKIQVAEFKKTLKELPNDIANDKEKITRYLLLTAILDQQAESPSARKFARLVYEQFADGLFAKPFDILHRLKDLKPYKDEYHVSPAIGRVMPRFAWIVLRVGGFLIYEIELGTKILSQELANCANPPEAFSYLHKSSVLESILREKAARLYISWIGHPELGIDVSNGRWKARDFLMPVDGHVGKIFSRTGIANEIIHEGKNPSLTSKSNPRWNIIKASDMRKPIEEIVKRFDVDPIMVDHGAFQIGFYYCPDNLKGICCEKCTIHEHEVCKTIGCKQKCVLSEYCKKNTVWRAY